MDLRNLKTFISVAELAKLHPGGRSSWAFPSPPSPFRSSSWNVSWESACLSAPATP